MYRSSIILPISHQTFDLRSSRYWVHRRIMDACEGDARVLFRIEDSSEAVWIAVQSHVEPAWDYAFGDLRQVDATWEVRSFDPHVQAGTHYRFRVLANPTYKKDGKRWEIQNERELVVWLNRKLGDAGAILIACSVRRLGFIKSFKEKEAEREQQHWAVRFSGEMRAIDTQHLRSAVENGMGSAKGYGFGLLSVLGVIEPPEEFSPQAWGHPEFV